MFTIVASLLVLLMYDKIKSRILFWVLFVIVVVPVLFIAFEWLFVGILTVLLFYIIPGEGARRVISPVVTGALWIVMSFTMPEMEGVAGLMANPDFLPFVMASISIGCFVAAFLLKHYNGQRGKRMKWLFYVIYPVHLAVLAAVALAFGWLDLSWFGF